MKAVIEFGASRRWLALACISFAMLLLVAQAVHVHTDNGLSAAACPICVSAGTSAPVAAVVSQIILVAVAVVAVFCASQEPNAETILLLFIRPPPAA